MPIACGRRRRSLTRVDAVLAERSLLTHPFYQEWTAGRLSVDHFRRATSCSTSHLSKREVGHDLA